MGQQHAHELFSRLDDEVARIAWALGIEIPSGPLGELFRRRIFFMAEALRLSLEIELDNASGHR
jgi:hypothetical protein